MCVGLGFGVLFSFISPFSFATLGPHKILLSPASLRSSCVYNIVIIICICCLWKTGKLSKKKNKTSAPVVFALPTTTTARTPRQLRHYNNIIPPHHYDRGLRYGSVTGHDKSHASGHAIPYTCIIIYIYMYAFLTSPPTTTSTLPPPIVYTFEGRTYGVWAYII